MTVASHRAVPMQPAFTLEQTTALTAWSANRPAGLRVRMVTSHPDFLEVAEVYRRHPAGIRYLLNPTDCGTVFLVRTSGGAWELGSVEMALTKLLVLEARDAGG